MEEEDQCRVLNVCVRKGSWRTENSEKETTREDNEIPFFLIFSFFVPFSYRLRERGTKKSFHPKTAERVFFVVFLRANISIQGGW